MKLLVCISKTPDTTTRIDLGDDQKSIREDGVQYILNPYDEWYALVRALELKEQTGGTVTVVHVGTQENDAIIRKALAIGADDAVRIDAEAQSSEYVARQIAHYAGDQAFDIIFAGKETISYNGAAVASMLSELLDHPYVSFASDMKWEDDHAILSRDIEGGIEKVRVRPPFVLSAAKGLAEQRIPNMRGIMMAKRKPLEVIPAIEVQNNIEVTGMNLPEQRTEVKMLDPENMDELVRLLHEESKVI